MPEDKIIFAEYLERLKAQPQATREHEIALKFLTGLTAEGRGNGLTPVMLGLMAEYGFKKPNQLAQALWSVLKSVIPDEYIDRRNEKVPNTPAVILTVLRAVKMLEGGATLSALRSQSINVEKLGIRSLPKARAKSADLTPAQIRRVIDAERAGATHAEIARVQPVGEGKIRDILREARGGKKPTL